ncbi:DeoR/GlpR family DNA-binding transcription regulator [Microbaculum marinum]|uniref:DeoR/GlpR family DNA-binding transcription regulator n=1 Tax=Microbaculum marinum TaxID=1764581 RepID=A0AAW9RR65_9HYPH
MIPAQRRAVIMEYLRQHGAASVQALCEAVGASESTMRRDLDWLSAHSHIERSHGGATLTTYPRSTFEPEAAISAHTAANEKRAIGAAAAELVRPGQSVIFDSSSTVHAAAAVIAERQIPITAVTNDLAIARTLSETESIRVIVLGGTIRRGSNTLTGEPGEDYIGSLHADLALLGAHRVAGGRLTETSPEVARMKRGMIACARQTVLLVDSTKFRAPAFATICGITEIDRVITDQGASGEVISDLAEAGVDVMTVAVSSDRGGPDG